MSYEHRDASLMIIGTSAGVLAVLIVLSILTAVWFYTAKYGGPQAIASAGRTTSFQFGAKEEPEIVRDYARAMQASSQHLDGYRWVDRKDGVVQIPIQRAMQLLASGAQPAPAPQVPGQVP